MNRRCAEGNSSVCNFNALYVRGCNCCFSEGWILEVTQCRRLRFVLVPLPDLKCFMFIHLLFNMINKGVQLN